MRNQKFAKLVSYEKINNSNMGNPNYMVTLDTGLDVATLRSSSNCSWCYGICRNWVGKTVTYHTTKNDRVDYMKLTEIKDTYTDELLMGRG